jgi:hypothetical protein
MMDIEKAFVKGLVQSTQWKVIEHYAEELIKKIKEEPKIKDNEWDTLKTTLQDEGRIQGIRQFIQELFNIASQT